MFGKILARVFSRPKPYDRQLIVKVESDKITNTGALELNYLANQRGIPSHIVGVERTSSGRFNQRALGVLRERLAELTPQSRVYLDGHGDWQEQKLGDFTAEEVADLLVDNGMPMVKVVSVLGCESGRDLGTSNTARTAHSMNSFASELHRLLKEKGGLEVVLYARTHSTHVATSEDADRRRYIGHKYTFGDDDEWEGYTEGHRRANSKLRFFWEGGEQRRESAY